MAENDVVQTSYGPVPREVMERYRLEYGPLGWTDNEIGHFYHKLLEPHGYEFGSEIDDPTDAIAG